PSWPGQHLEQVIRWLDGQSGPRRVGLCWSPPGPAFLGTVHELQRDLFTRPDVGHPLAFAQNGPAEKHRWSHHAAAVRAHRGERGPLHPLTTQLLAEDPDLHVVALAVHVDGEVAEVVDQLVQVLGLDLAEVEAHPVLPERGVDLVLGLGRDQTGEPDAGPQELQRRPDVDLDWSLVVVHGVDDHAEIPRRRGRPFGQTGRRGRRGPVIDRRDEAVGLLDGDLAGGQHVQDLLAVVTHGWFLLEDVDEDRGRSTLDRDTGRAQGAEQLPEDRERPERVHAAGQARDEEDRQSQDQEWQRQQPDQEQRHRDPEPAVG